MSRALPSPDGHARSYMDDIVAIQRGRVDGTRAGSEGYELAVQDVEAVFRSYLRLRTQGQARGLDAKKGQRRGA